MEQTAFQMVGYGCDLYNDTNVWEEEKEQGRAVNSSRTKGIDARHTAKASFTLCLEPQRQRKLDPCLEERDPLVDGPKFLGKGKPI